MTVKEEIHQLIDDLSDDEAELARQVLEDLREAADVNGEPLDADVLSSLDRGLADVEAGRVKDLEQYRRERKL